MSDNVRRALSLLQVELAAIEASVDPAEPRAEVGPRVDSLLAAIAELAAVCRDWSVE